MCYVRGTDANPGMDATLESGVDGMLAYNRAIITPAIHSYSGILPFEYIAPRGLSNIVHDWNNIGHSLNSWETLLAYFANPNFVILRSAGGAAWSIPLANDCGKFTEFARTKFEPVQ